MAKIKHLFIQFAGSFQARLAVGGDSSASSPTDPYGTYGPPSRGMAATFAYQEKPFDRIIRLSKPVDLRNARIDPWTDTTVNSVQINVGKGLVSAPPGNPFQGQVVSLGDKVKWIEDEGYEIDGLELSIASFLAGGKPSGKLGGWNVRSDPQAAAEYQKEKPKRIEAAKGVDPVRARVLKEVDLGKTWAPIFTNIGVYDFALAAHGLHLNANFGSSGTMDKPTNYSWSVHLEFSRWDADTLGGQVSGSIHAIHQDMLRATGKAVMDILKILETITK